MIKNGWDMRRKEVGTFLKQSFQLIFDMKTLIIFVQFVVAMAALLLLLISILITVIPFTSAFHIPTFHKVYKMSTKLQATKSSDTINTEQLLSTLIHAGKCSILYCFTLYPFI